MTQSQVIFDRIRRQLYMELGNIPVTKLVRSNTQLRSVGLAEEIIFQYTVHNQTTRVQRLRYDGSIFASYLAQAVILHFQDNREISRRY